MSGSSFAPFGRGADNDISLAGPSALEGQARALAALTLGAIGVVMAISAPARFMPRARRCARFRATGWNGPRC